jgi:hypothetical protein
MKDPIVIAGLGFFVYGVYFLLMKSNGKFIRNILLILIGFYLMRAIKVYVIASILPATLVWFFLMFKDRIKNDTLRNIAGPFFLIFGGGVAFLAIQQFSSSFSVLSLDGFLHEAEKMQWWLALSTERDDGTGYSLSFEPTMTGLIRVFPEAVNVALFRPYLWEARKVIVMPSAIESLFTLGFTVYVLYKTGIKNIFKNVLGEPTVTFCFLFALIFAFAVGFTSMNFGALARYKIPCLPFYFSGLIILLSKAKIPPKIQNQNPSSDIAQKSKPNAV